MVQVVFCNNESRYSTEKSEMNYLEFSINNFLLLDTYYRKFLDWD